MESFEKDRKLKNVISGGQWLPSDNVSCWWKFKLFGILLHMAIARAHPFPGGKYCLSNYMYTARSSRLDIHVHAPGAFFIVWMDLHALTMVIIRVVFNFSCHIHVLAFYDLSPLNRGIRKICKLLLVILVWHFWVSSSLGNQCGLFVRHVVYRLPIFCEKGPLPSICA